MPGWNYHLTYSGADEGRQERLERFEKDLQSRLGLTREQLVSRIDRIEDHKGDLTIEWRIVPSGAERQAAELAWEAQLEYTVHHVVPNGP